MKTVYKFCSININTIKSLVNSELWFGNPLHFNDPLDCCINIKFSGTLEGVDLENFYEDYNRIMPEKVEINSKLTLVGVDETIFENDYKNFYDYCAKRYLGMTCFSKEYEQPLMWSHYADSHKGLVLMFNQHMMFDESQKVNFIEVKYPKQIEAVNQSKTKLIENKFDFSIDDVIGTKYPFWAYEKEVRAYVSNEEPNIEKLIKFNTDSLYGIIFGSQTTKKDKEFIMDTLAKGRLVYFNSFINSHNGMIGIKPTNDKSPRFFKFNN